MKELSEKFKKRASIKKKISEALSYGDKKRFLLYLKNKGYNINYDQLSYYLNPYTYGFRRDIMDEAIKFIHERRNILNTFEQELSNELSNL